MFNRSKMLLLSALTLCVLIIAVGCDQPEDVITPDGKAYLTLKPTGLPNNPSGTIYELWVANNTDTTSLGKFGYDFFLQKFLTEDGSDRPDKGRFFLDEAIGSYTTIIVSIEPVIDASPNSPASIMLIDFTSSQTIKLVLPLIDSLWSSTARYSMKSTSDGIDTTSTDGSSIWFCSFEQSERTITDTFTILSWTLDSGDYVPPSLIIPRTNVIGIDSSTLVENIDTITVLGLDTIHRSVVRFDLLSSEDTSDYYPTSLNIVYDTISRTVTAEQFTQDDFDVPNLQRFGWKYRGWIISDAIDTNAVGTITKPAWSVFVPILTDIEGGLLSTGTFYDIALPDEANPHVDTNFKNPPRVPPFPGEDFLLNLPAPLTSVPNLAGTAGHVFITIEPEFYNSNTNFPLFAFIGDLPNSSAASGLTSQGYTLTGYMYSNDGFRGFPTITVIVDKF